MSDVGKRHKDNNHQVGRIAYLDVAKFIGLALVCFCHIPFPEGKFHIWVYSFHMPLFFLVSGIFFSTDKFTIGKNAKQLLVPFLFFNFLACVISICIGFLASGELKIMKVSIDFFLESHYVIGPSWFLVSLFIIRIYCGVITRFFGKVWLIVSAIIILILFYITRDSEVWYAFSMGSTVLGLPFYMIGMYGRRIFLNEMLIGKWWVPLVALILSIPAIYNGQVGIHANCYGVNIFLFVIYGLCGTVLLVSLSRYVKIPHSILTVFMDGALFFICMHTLIFEYSILIWNKITGDFSGNTLIEKIVFTTLTFIISYPIILLILNNAPILLGKTNKKNVVN